VLVNDRDPGFGGQAFIAETLPKIRQIRGWIDELRKPIDLVVDGGVVPRRSSAWRCTVRACSSWAMRSSKSG